MKIHQLNISVFIIPGEEVRNGDDRLVVLNREARQVIEKVRGQHPEYVFTFKGQPIGKMNNTGWKNARKKIGLPQLRVHDLRHTCGSRLRAMGVSFEDRQDILGHRSKRITTHCSTPELSNLIAAANRICQSEDGDAPVLIMLNRRKSQTQKSSSPQNPYSR